MPLPEPVLPPPPARTATTEPPRPRQPRRAQRESPTHTAAAAVPRPEQAPSPGTPAASPPPAAAGAPIAAAWQRSLADWLAEHKTYPEAARRTGTEGGVIVRFTVDRAGRVLDVQLVRSSGSAVLDTAAQAILRDATLPPFTTGMAQDRVTVTVQIRYTLEN